MALNKLKKPAKNKVKKKVGRGNGSGKGTYAGRGMNGQSSRSGGKVRPGFEGGQTPLIRRMPKLKGFKNPTKLRYQVLNVHQLEVFKNGATIDKETLAKKKLIRSMNKPVKILSAGELTKKLTIIIESVSVAAQKKIEAAGGKVEALGSPKKKRKEAVNKKKMDAKEKNKAARAKRTTKKKA